MSTDAIKLELIQWLSRLDDPGLLTSLLQFKKAAEAGDWFDELTEDQRSAIAEGEADVRAGRVIDSEAFWMKHGRKTKG